MRRLFLAVALALVVDAAAPLPATAEAAAAAEPTDTDRSAAAAVIERFHDTLLEVMKNAKSWGYQGRYDHLAPVMTAAFDLEFMAEKSAGRHWRIFDDDQKRRWTDTLDRHTIATYAGRFVGYSGQTFETLGSEPGQFGTIMVRTRLVQPADDNVELTYRMRKSDSAWRIVDIYLSGTVSELALRRAEYGSVLERDGLDKLIEQLEGKITDFRNDSNV